MSKWFDSIKGLPAAVKAAAVVIVLVIGAGITIVAAILRSGGEAATVPETEVTESEQTTEQIGTGSKEAVTEWLETETDVPYYIPCELEAVPFNKELTVYITNDQQETIRGKEFSFKLVREEDYEPLSMIVETIAGWSGQIADMAKNIDTEGYSIEKYQQLLLDKRDAIEAYLEILGEIEGEVYTDGDTDGVITASGLSGGDYRICFLPVGEYDAADYGLAAKVSDTLSYQPLSDIEKRMVSASEAGDSRPDHSGIKVTAEEEDTIEYVESVTFGDDSGYSEWTKLDVGVEASVSEELSVAESAADANAAAEEAAAEVPADSGAAAPEDAAQTPGTETQQQGTQGGTAATVSRLEIPAEATLYANKAASKLTLPVTAENVSSLTLTASAKLKKLLTITAGRNSYTVKLSSPSSVKNKVSGTLTLSGTDAAGQKLSAECELDIIGTATVLKDAYGNQLYIKGKKEKPVKATVGNYKKGNKYCTKYSAATATYYGWQQLKGATYYYDSNGEKVTGRQVIRGVAYKFDDTGKLVSKGRGIDVSSWQGEIDWKLVSQAASFAIIRCGLRGTAGGIAQDSRAVSNVKAANQNGIKTGLYFYSRAKSEADAVEEASVAVKVAKEAGGIKLPIYIDVEDSAMSGLSTSQRDAIVTAFAKTVKSAGYSAGVLASGDWLTEKLTPSSYSGISVWCIEYNTECTYEGEYKYWQYSAKGYVPGIVGEVNLTR